LQLINNKNKQYFYLFIFIDGLMALAFNDFVINRGPEWWRALQQGVISYNPHSKILGRKGCSSGNVNFCQEINQYKRGR
jgi:hypothetical protein